jgi:uncharacterized protein
LQVTQEVEAPLRVVSEDGKLIVERLRLAQSHWQKFRGLMLDTSLQPDEALLLTKCNSIHCCFMRMAIDVLFMDAQGRIVHIIEEMRPWTFSPLVRRAKDVIECYPGTVKRLGIQVADILSIVDK